ncbi:MAG: lipid-A-disaccharide synthase [Bacteroidales bacterium]|nr:lipid-A-disaccharide synthase [Bacteroidales bacterium]
MRYYLTAGEASGDLHGSNLIRGLRQADPDAVFRFFGGDMMAAAAEQEPVVHYREGAVMGPSDILAKAGKLLRNLSLCKKDISDWKPDAVILIDYPGFNMRIARYCHARGIRVFYYIPPKTWASREGRNRQLKEWVDIVFIVFPFEAEYFRQAGVPFVFKGNPLPDAIANHEFRRPCEGRYIAVLPGSRKSEISRTLPVCMEAAGELGMKVLVAGAPARSIEDYAPWIEGHPEAEVMFNRTYDILKYADAAIINSGTASLEAALIGTPQVVCWSASALTWWYANHILKVGDHIPFISLGNLCLGREAFRELLQDDFNSNAVREEVSRLLDDAPYRERMLADYEIIRESMGGAGASAAVARAMIDEIKSNTI